MDLNLNKIISILKSIGPASIGEIQQEYSKIYSEELTTREVFEIYSFLKILISLHKIFSWKVEFSAYL